MAANDRSFTSPSPDQRRIAVGQFERASQVIAKEDFDYGIQLLLTCCKLDPANLIYRRHLRQAEKTKYNNNMRGSRLSILTTSPAKARIKSAKRSREYLKVLEHGEEVLTRNPWDTGTQLDMAEAADALGLVDVAAWIIEQARQKNPKDATVNRSLARLYEKRGNFTMAIKLWEMVHEVDPSDVEAHHKAKDLAASDTIARGQYEQSSGLASAQRDGKSVNTANRAKPEAASPPRTGKDRVAREAEALRSRIEADPTNASVYLQLAGLYRRADLFDQAREVLKEGSGPTGGNFDLLVELADLEIEAFRRDLVHTEEQLKHDSEDEDLLTIHKQLSAEINSRELELFRRKADRYPTDKNFRFELGVRLLRAGQIDEAIAELQPLRSDVRHQWRALLHLGLCFKSRNNWRLAQRNFEEALQSMPATETAARKEILYHLASGCAEAGELSKAVDHAHDLANLDFSYRDIGKLLNEWEERLQET